MAKRSKRKRMVGNGIPAQAAVAGDVTPPRPTSWFRRDWLWGLILVLAVILVYQPVWYAGFIWDDDGRITANPCIIGPLGLKEVWTTSHADLCPLVYTTFWVEHALWGLAPLPYHLVNVLLHGACAILLWRVLRTLQVPGAWLGAALWALHPVQVETAAWITEMKNTQSGVFYLLTILFFVRGLRARAIGDRRGDRWNYALTLLFAALAMASKSSTVVLPIVLGLCAWWVEGRWRWHNLSRLGPIALMAVFPSALTLWTQKLLNQGSESLQYTRSLPERLATAGDAVWFYLGKLLWPHPLIFIYPRWQVDAGSWLSYLPLLAVMIVLFLLWRKRETWSRPYFFTFAYFVVALLPILGLIDGFFWRYSLVGDHFQYLASMGPLALAGSSLVRCADFVIPGRSGLQSGFRAGLLLILGVLSWRQAWIYENLETLWTDTLAKNPNCWMAHNNLGYAFFQKGQVDEATAHYQKALELNPNDAEAHNNLGNVFIKKGQVDDAMGHYQKALKINPYLADVHYNLGNVLFAKGQMAEAIAEYQKALKINPYLADVHDNLGIALFNNVEVDEAIIQLQKALEINPNHADAHNNLGNALFQKGQVDEAMAQYQMALELNPNYAEAHNNLGNALIKKGQVDKAIAQYQMALELKPDFAEAHSDLGVALFQEGQMEEAIIQFQEALRLKPEDSISQNNLAKVQAVARQRAGQK